MSWIEPLAQVIMYNIYCKELRKKHWQNILLFLSLLCCIEVKGIFSEYIVSVVIIPPLGIYAFPRLIYRVKRSIAIKLSFFFSVMCLLFDGITFLILHEQGMLESILEGGNIGFEAMLTVNVMKICQMLVTWCFTVVIKMANRKNIPELIFIAVYFFVSLTSISICMFLFPENSLLKGYAYAVQIMFLIVFIIYFSWIVVKQKRDTKIQESIETLRGLKHDVKSHYGLIMKLAREAPDELNQYMEELEAEYAKGNVCTSSNVVLANAINYNNQQCLEYGIDFQYSLLTDTIPLSVMEQNIILHNIFLNAIESCQRCPKDRERFIKFLIEQNDYGEVVIKCENSCCNVVSLETQKENKKEHGIGLKSIRKIVKLHRGKFFCDYDESVFRIIITFRRK